MKRTFIDEINVNITKIILKTNFFKKYKYHFYSVISDLIEYSFYCDDIDLFIFLCENDYFNINSINYTRLLNSNALNILSFLIKKDKININDLYYFLEFIYQYTEINDIMLKKIIENYELNVDRIKNNYSKNKIKQLKIEIRNEKIKKLC